MAFYVPQPHYTHRTTSASAVPRRSDSLAAGAAKPGAIFQLVADDQQDARRVLAHGQEDDLRTALGRVLGRVDELTALLKAAYTKQTELETSLTLAKSNLQMAQANADVLEDMLRRNIARRDAIRSPGDDAKRLSVDSDSSPISPATVAAKHEEGGFFATFGRSSKNPSLVNLRGANHGASASMPSLVADGNTTKQIDELKTSLESERAKLKQATDDKAALEAELESLSQALFEEANKMVATERIKAAELKEELTEARRQKDALVSALKVVETENGQLRARTFDSAPPSAATASFATDAGGASPQFEQRVLSRASSTLALKSPAPRPPRSPMRRSNSLSASSVGSRPGSPLVSSPLASRPPSIAEHGSPERLTASISLPNAPFELHVQDATPPAASALGQPAFVVQGATPPTEQTLFAPPVRSGSPTPIPTPMPSVSPESAWPAPMRRTTSSATATPDPNFHDPNLPDGAPDPHVGSNPDAPLFTLPTFDMGAIARSLPASPSLASSSFTSWLASPGTSPDFAGSATTAPITIPARPVVAPEEESPWADVLSSAAPALSRMSSMSSVASSRLSASISRAKEAIASFAPALDDESAYEPQRPGVVGERLARFDGRR